MLTVGVSFRRKQADIVAAVAYAGLPLAFVGGTNSTDGGQKYRSEIWYLVDPPIGTDTVVVDFTGSDEIDSAVGGGTSYTGVDQRGTVAVHGLNYLIKKICHDDRVLIVDDVLDTGHTIKAVVEEIRARARGNSPKELRVAVPWYKPTRNETDLVPDYYIKETAEWLVFPHELDALSPEEMQKARPELHAIIHGASPAA